MNILGSGTFLFFSPTFAVLLVWQDVFSCFQASSGKTTTFACWHCLPQMHQKGNTLVFVLSSWFQTKPAQLSSMPGAVGAPGHILCRSGSREPHCPCGTAVSALQQGCGLTAVWGIKHFHLQRMVISLLDHVGVLQ